MFTKQSRNNPAIIAQSTPENPVRILSIDPGLTICGWAIIEHGGIYTRLINYEAIKFNPRQTIGKRLHELYFRLFEIISNNHVTHMAIETPFLGKNAATFLKLGYVGGLLLLLAEIHDLSVLRFSPQEVKKMVTGTGASDKEAVCRAVMRCFKGFEMPQYYDVSDAIAIGICALRSLSARSRI